jgi:hypothetical protein
MDLPRSAVAVDGAHRAAEKNGPRSRADASHLSLEPPRKRDIVGIEARDVPSAGLLQPAIQRLRETELLLVSNDAQT